MEGARVDRGMGTKKARVEGRSEDQKNLLVGSEHPVDGDFVLVGGCTRGIGRG